MSNNSRVRTPRRALGILLVLVFGLTALSVTPAQADQSLVVSPHPDQTHPRVMNGRVYAIATSGDLVAVGGTFTQVRNGAGGAPDQPRQWIFMYNWRTGKIVETFNPVLTGPAPNTSGLIGDRPGVETIEFAPDGQSLYVGGWFTSVNGVNTNRITRLNLDGTTRTTFKAGVNQPVADMALVGNRLIVGGDFSVANRQPVSRLVSLDPATGDTQTDFNLPALDSRDQYAPYIQEMDASPDGRWLALAGNFQTIGTVARNQVALIDLQGTPKVANWSTDGYSNDCNPSYDDSWVRGVDISPDSSYVVFSGTGAYRGADSLCDTVARFELPPTSSGDHLQPTWRNLSGGDTLWATHITSAAVYVGGHMRWMNNPHPSPSGDDDGPGSVRRDGIVALDPRTGVPLSWNPGRDRGRGAEAIASNNDFLFIGSDTDLFNGEIRQRLADLPVLGGSTNPQPSAVSLPVTLNFAVGGELRTAAFDGQSVGAVSTRSASGWTELRDGFVQAGQAALLRRQPGLLLATVLGRCHRQRDQPVDDRRLRRHQLQPDPQRPALRRGRDDGRRAAPGERPDLLRQVRRLQALPPRLLPRERDHRRRGVPGVQPALRRSPRARVRRRLALRSLEQRGALPLLRSRRRSRLRQPRGRRCRRLDRLEPGARSVRHSR